jgi:hypothetical protein
MLVLYFWTFPSSCLYLKTVLFIFQTQHFGDWSLSPSSGKIYSVGPVDRASPYLRTPVPESESQSHFTTDSQSVCLSWCRAPSGAHDQIFISIENYSPVHMGRPL